MELQVKLLRDDAKPPEYAHDGDAGMDVFSTEDYVLEPGERKVFKTGFSMAFPEGYVCHVWDKSGLAAKHGIKTMAGVIDSTYRGEVGVVLLNTSDESFEVKKGEKIAQLVFIPVAKADPEVVEELEDTVRGEGAWGSTGRR